MAELGSGHNDASTFDYDMQYCLQHDPAMAGNVIGATALSVRLPLSLEWQKFSHWPPFLLDVLPQGHARQRLAKAMNLNPDSSACELPLLLRVGGGSMQTRGVHYEAALVVPSSLAERKPR
ncbi:HipA N-terminal domain-containing protein [Rhodopila globiformis]|uniref:HipA N-terminal domain-containing protein n=1 Tax=Rhodopila globiformis TaxID=1071 RepID=UPI001304DE71|nr:HipA N-terminal domain-containing protein [Rhodopila globiformis]